MAFNKTTTPKHDSLTLYSPSGPKQTTFYDINSDWLATSPGCVAHLLLKVIWQRLQLTKDPREEKMLSKIARWITTL